MLDQVCHHFFSQATCATVSDNWAPYGAAALACSVTALFLKNCFQGPTQIAPTQQVGKPKATLVNDLIVPQEWGLRFDLLTNSAQYIGKEICGEYEKMKYPNPNIQEMMLHLSTAIKLCDQRTTLDAFLNKIHFCVSYFEALPELGRVEKYPIRGPESKFHSKQLNAILGFFEELLKRLIDEGDQTDRKKVQPLLGKIKDLKQKELTAPQFVADSKGIENFKEFFNDLVEQKKSSKG